MPLFPKRADFGPTTQQLDAALLRDAVPAGTRVGGYQIVDVLARGRWSVVYLALDASLQRQVAIKEYLPIELATRSGPDERAAGLPVRIKPGADAALYHAGLQHFLEEAKQLARFEHPALARVFSFWEENGSAYAVMPYLKGQPLAEVVKAWAQPLGEPELRALLSPLLGALAVVHSALPCHGHIGPDSIFMRADGQPVLMNLGRTSGEVLPVREGAGASAPSPMDFAPLEQCKPDAHLPLGPWSDLYAVAAVMHWAITGQAPVNAAARAAGQTQRPLAQAALSVQAQHPGVSYSAPFLAALDKALALRPQDRPRSVAEWLLMLTPTAPARAAPMAGAASALPCAEPDEASLASPVAVVASLPSTPLALPAAQVSPRWRWAARAAVLLSLGVAWALWRALVPSDSPVAAGGAEPVQAEQAPASAQALVRAEAGSAAAVPVAAASLRAGVDAAASAAHAMPAAASMPMAAGVAPIALSDEPSVRAGDGDAVRDAPQSRAVKVRASPAKGSPDAVEAQRQSAFPPQASSAPSSSAPRAACGKRANFSLYYCMRQQCARPHFTQHPQCVSFRLHDDVR